MADINIERKSGAGSVLPWIIGLLVLALLAWWLLAGRGDDEAAEGVYTDTTAVVGAPVTTEPGFDTAAGAGLGYDATTGDTLAGTGVGADTGVGATTTTP